MTYEQWEQSVPKSITSDSLWKMKAYRLALFLADLAWRDTSKIARDRRTCSIADQLYRAVGKIGANLAEGYSRGSGKERAHFYEYSLGSLRESRDWYYKARQVLGEKATSHRLEICAELIRLVLTMIARERTQNRRFSSTREEFRTESRPTDRRVIALER